MVLVDIGAKYTLIHNNPQQFSGSLSDGGKQQGQEGPLTLKIRHSSPGEHKVFSLLDIREYSGN